jgi:hypothetical protein
VATAREQGTIQGLVYVKRGRKEIFGLQTNQTVKRKRKLRRRLLRRKLRRKLQMRRPKRKTQKGRRL